MLIIKWSVLLYTNISSSNEPTTRCTGHKIMIIYFFCHFHVILLFSSRFLYFLLFSTLFVHSPFHLLVFYFVFIRLSYFLLPLILSFFISCLLVSVFYSTTFLHVGQNSSEKLIIPQIKTFLLIILWNPETGSMFTRVCHLFLF